MTTEKIKITENGLAALNQKISEKEKLVKEIQAEKAIAYTASGDGWHDNPGFNQLEQKEFQAVNELHELKMKRDSATIIKITTGITNAIQIGSIVKLHQRFLKDNSSRVITWEIVGHQESDIKNNRVAYDTPIGQVLLGKKTGESVEAVLPIGKVIFRILELFNNWESANINNKIK